MGSIAFPAPVLPGMEAAPSETAARMGAHPGLEDFLSKGTLTLIRVYQMTTPAGDVVTTYEEADSIEQSFQNQAEDPSELAALLREHVKRTHGIDIAAGPPPAAEQWLEFSGPAAERHTGLGFSAPVQSGKTEILRAIGQETAGPRKAQWEAVNRESGVSLHRAFIISTPMGDFVSVYFEAPDPVEANRRFAANDSEFASYFKGQVSDALGIDFNEPLPPVKTVFDTARTTATA